MFWSAGPPALSLSPICSALLRPSQGPVASQMALTPPWLPHPQGFLCSFHCPPSLPTLQNCLLGALPRATTSGRP